MAALPPGVKYADNGIELAVTQRGWWTPPFTSCMLASYCMILAKQGYTLPLARAKDAYNGTSPQVVNMVLALHRATGRPLDSGTTLQDTINAVDKMWSSVSEKKPVIHVGAVGKAAVIDLLNKDAAIRISGGPLSAWPRAWNLPAGYGNARHALVLQGTRLSPTTGVRQVYLVDPMFRPATGYQGQWVNWDKLYSLIDKDASGAAVITWGLPDEMLTAPTPPPPDGNHEQPPTPPPGTGDTSMPAIKTYQPGYTATINKGANVRVAPSTSAKVIRTTSAPEPWLLTGTVTGDVSNGSSDWLTRWSETGKAWEYTHASNASAPKAPPSQKTVTDALVSSMQTTAILREG